MKKLLVAGTIFTVLAALVLVVRAWFPASDATIEHQYTQAAALWPPPYTTVRAYLYNMENRPGLDPAIIQNGDLISTVIDRHGIELTPEQTARLRAAISQTPPHHNGTITVSLGHACIFDPHHAFVFYDAQSKPVAWIEACTLCHDIAATPARPLQFNYDFVAVEKLITELGLPIFHNSDDLAAFRQTLR